MSASRLGARESPGLASSNGSPPDNALMRSVLDRPTYVRCTWIILAVLVATSAYLAAVERWTGVAVLGGTVACSLAFILCQDRLPRLFNLLFVLAGAVNAGAYVFDLWDRIGVYDELVHAYTTFAIAAAFGYLALKDSPLAANRPWWRFIAAVTALGFGIGLLWEGFEWLIGMIGDTADTLVDLVMDTLGAVAAGLFCAWAANRERKERGPKRLNRQI